MARTIFIARASHRKAKRQGLPSVSVTDSLIPDKLSDLTLTSGKDMDIIGSKAQGEKITAKVGGNLKIETLQEKETYEEDNHSTGFGVSWNVNQTKKETTDANGDTKIETLRSFSKPTFSGSWNKGNIDSHYRSARDQAGFFAGSKGFDIYVEKDTDLKGGVIVSNATSDKNRLSTGTLSFSDLKNEADYSAKSIGAAYHKYGNYKNMTEDEQNKVYNTIGLAPNISMPVKGDSSSTTKSVVAAGTIDIRDNPTQDISALSRDTTNSLNELGKIFDKAKIEEQQELAAVFGEESFRLAHNLKDDGSGRKIAIHFAIGGIMSAITGADFASGAIGAGLNEALIKALDGKDPGTAQIISAIIGAAAAKVVGGNALAGASAAASGTKWNYFLMSRPNEFGINNLAKNILKKKDGQELSEEEADQLLRGMNSILSAIDPDLGNAKDPFAEDINTYQYAIRYLEYRGITKESGMQFFTAYNEVVRKRDWNGVYKQPGTIYVDADSKTETMVDVPRRPPIGVYNPTITEPYQEGEIIGAETSSKAQKAESDKGFDALKSIVVNGVSEKANLLPAAIKADGHFEKAISKYLKTGGVVALGWTFADMRQDWNTYSGVELGSAIATDFIPLGSSIIFGELGGEIGTLIEPGGGTVLVGAFGAFIGAVGGDYLKYRIRKGILSNPNINNDGGR